MYVCVIYYFIRVFFLIYKDRQKDTLRKKTILNELFPDANKLKQQAIHNGEINNRIISIVCGKVKIR